MSILDAKYKIPDKDRYSKKVTKLIKLCLHKDPTRRPTCKGIIGHLENIKSGGKGTLSSKKDKKRSNSQTVKSSPELKLAPKVNEAELRRKSHAEVQPSEEIKENVIDEGWDPFDVNGADDNIFDDNFDGNLYVLHFSLSLFCRCINLLFWMYSLSLPLFCISVLE